MATLIGFDMLHYAVLTTDATEGVVYETPKRVLGAVSASINPNTSENTFFADDGPMETNSALGQIDLELSAADIPFEDQSILLGHKLIKGVLARSASDIAPFVAIGGRSLKSNGKYRYFWLLKGKMSVPEKSYQTKQDGVEYQAANIKGTFVKRDADALWIMEADEDEKGVDQTLITNWFKNVPVMPTEA